MQKEKTQKGCQKCNKLQGVDKQRNIDSKNEFIVHGYTVIGHYNGTHNKVTLVDREGYLYYTKHNSFFSNNRQTYLFSKFNPYSIYNINLWIVKNNIPIKLLSEKFEGGDIPLIWECECGNTFSERCCNVLRGNKRYRRIRCEECSGKQSSISIEVESYLQQLDVPYLKEYRIADCKDKKPLPFDFAIIENGKLKGLIEVDGGQHYTESCFRNNYTEQDKIDTYNYIKLHDNIKNNYCKDNNIPLLRIPYWEFYKEKRYTKLIDEFVHKIKK